ncbi:DUF1573 domain-containing protein [Imtechella halotolerans]|uniref:DUF1573 domain-containing protein n=1 Tax=Imtechella halotolerans K1 TaxID=946077 RepID=I0WH25_9FLAO|nr:DUF1573 domain-containing protein [Imtechella halotolerans]EID75691.1 hypothetical protein W5A_05733 [Imtechella halotolerans K1]WMQ63482.1 DUF1573 domain-containing protein [Imtechella halotolerans]
MKKLITLLFLAAFTVTVSAQNAVAKMEFKTDEIDYGTIQKGSDGLRVFEFTNTGNAPLVITKINSSCGCTVPEWPKEPIAPGKTGKIQVKYDTTRVGPIRKTITVLSNSDTPTKVLKIKGTIIEASR